MTPLLFLAVDDSPGRYEEFQLLLNTDFIRELDDRHRLVVTHDGALSRQLAMIADVILLDHDMPGEDGRARARWIAWAQPRAAVIITSTTDLEGVREEMRDTLTAAGIPVLLCPADHHGCEVEWVRWAEGVWAGRVS